MERLAPVGPFPLDLNHIATILGVTMTVNPPTPEQVATAEKARADNGDKDLYYNTGDKRTEWNEDAIHDLSKNENTQTPIENSSGVVNKRDEAVIEPQTADTFPAEEEEESEEESETTESGIDPDQPIFDFTKGADE